MHKVKYRFSSYIIIYCILYNHYVVSIPNYWYQVSIITFFSLPDDMGELYKYMLLNDFTKISVLILILVVAIKTDIVWPTVIELLLIDIII